MLKKRPTGKRLKEAFRYDPESGQFYWRIKPGPSVKVGQKVGTIKNRGYEAVRLDGFPFKSHRLAWFFVNGNWPKGQIDHINGIRNDNRIFNLREATPSQNRVNTKTLRADNKSGYTGIKFDKNRNNWRAKIGKINCGRHHTIEEAIKARNAKGKEIFGEFFNEQHFQRLPAREKRNLILPSLQKLPESDD